MSRIDQLSVQGIRNFGPESPEIIQFEPPVTLILGKNGSGKTTIIEALKYATTGEMPAGTGKGQNFVHDPKLTTKKMSIGKVQLMFRDERGNRFIVTRSMEARLLKSKMDFKSIDGTLSIQQPDGKYINHKNKVKDLNLFVSSTLGVSKALMNNVLFCHQEDSNWPLDEGKKVKEKFDDIFNTTRYVKCQDDIRKEITEVRSKMKDVERTVDMYKMRKDQADEFRADVRRQTERRAGLEADMQQLDKERVNLEAKLKEAYDKHRQAEKVRGDLQSKTQRLEELQRNKRDLEADITAVIEASVEELNREIEKYQLTKNEREAELKKLTEEQGQLDNECRANTAAQQDKLVKLGKLQSEEEQYKKRICERDQLLVGLARRFQWAGHNSLEPDLPLSADQVRQYGGLLKESAEKAKKDESDCRRTMEEEEKKLLDAVNRIREEKVRLEQNIKTKEAALADHLKELSGVKAKLGAMEENSRQMVLLEEEQAEAQRKVERAEKEMDVEKLKGDIVRTKAEKEAHERELDRYRAQLKRLMGQRDVRVKLEMLQKDLAAKKTAERRLASRDKVEEAIRLLLGPDGSQRENLLSYYNARLDRVSAELDKEQGRLTKLGQDGAAIEADLRNSRKALEDKQAELAGHQQKLKNAGASGATELEADLVKVVKDLEYNEDLRGAVHGSEKMYNSFIDKIVKAKGKEADCPLCHHVFASDLEATEVVVELKERVGALPGKKAEYDRKITTLKANYEKLVGLRPVAQSAAQLEKTEIPRLREKLDGLERRAKEIADALAEAETLVDVNRNELDIGKKALPDIMQLDATRTDVKKLQNQIDEVKNQLGEDSADDSVSVEEVQQKVEELEGSCRASAQRIESLNERINKHQNRVAGLKQEANRLLERKLQLNDSLQQRGSLTDRRSALEKQIESAETEVDTWKEDLEPLIRKQMAAEAAHTDGQKKRHTLTEQARSRVEELQNHIRQLATLEGEIQHWTGLGKEAELERGRLDVERLKAEKIELEGKLREAAERAQSMRMALSNCENEERNFRNNLKLKLNEMDRRVVTEELDGLRRELEGFKVQTLEREISRFQQQLDAYKTRLGELTGEVKAVVAQVAELEAKLRRDEFATAEARWLEQVADLEIHQAIAEDLTSFYNALEWALMKFHKERMGVINGMVRQMWHSTYKGKDIDYVEIKAEESAATGANARRQYNYRVVMVKNGVEMDMRGRCSAGQKVLASLLIRMALAEAFSAKCGILALDEPTTNLDEDNIAALSDTILSLSSQMTRNQRKFQLVIITHDEKFLDRMSRDKRMDKYYRVDRNANTNLSEIRQFDVHGGGLAPSTKIKTK